MNHDDRLIVALDFPTMEQAKAVVLELGDNVSHYKVGMELYYAAGSEMIRFLKGHNKQVFLDLKLTVPTATALAPARKNSIASSAVIMPPIPIIGTCTF